VQAVNQPRVPYSKKTQYLPPLPSRRTTSELGVRQPRESVLNQPIIVPVLLSSKWTLNRPDMLRRSLSDLSAIGLA
jgi:hypothetical protein